MNVIVIIYFIVDILEDVETIIREHFTIEHKKEVFLVAEKKEL